jgi:ribosomal protein L12E/L44/L45/RPP1/RPP2
MAPRVASIIGVNNKQYLINFKGTDIADINRVIVDVGNPLARTTAGRVQMAEQLMQMKPDEFSIQQYAQVINTGRIDGMMESPVDQSNLIQQENERLMQGTKVVALIIDDHKEHILRHRTILNDIDIRLDDSRASAIFAHIQEHIDFARSADPAVLTMTNQQPLAPAPQQQAPASQAPNQPEQNSEGQSSIAQVAEASEQTNQQMMPGAPEPATPPAPFENLPTTTVPNQ